MITYPSTHGVFESSVTEVCEIVHNAGGLVYIDGANLIANKAIVTPESLVVMFLILIFIKLSVSLMGVVGLELVQLVL